MSIVKVDIVDFELVERILEEEKSCVQSATNVLRQEATQRGYDDRSDYISGLSEELSK